MDAIPVSELTISAAPATPLGAWGWTALEHWRRHLPKMTARLEAEGRLISEAMRAETLTAEEMEVVSEQLRAKGYSPAQAHEAAWEMVRETYILLPAEEETT